MSIAATFDEVCETLGVEVLYQTDGSDPVPFKALFEDYGNGEEPKGLHKRFSQGISHWGEFSFSANRIQGKPQSGDFIKVGETTYTVRQFKPTLMSGEVQFWDIFANTDQRS